MFYILIVLLALFAPKTAFGFEVFATATANPFSDRLGDKDYGKPEQTGGRIAAVGTFWPAAPVLGLPMELRLQSALQNTAWNDNRGPGEIQFRDGYQIRSTEVLIGYRWEFHPKLSTAILLGGGRSKIEYRTRENHDGGASHYAPTALTRHFTSQVDLRYLLPFDFKNLEFGVVAMHRLSVLQPHASYADVSPTTWSINFPSFPVPSLGVSLGVKL